MFMYLHLFVISFCFMASFLFHSTNACVHEAPTEENIIYSASKEPYRSVRKRTIDQFLRIHVVYDQSLEVLNTSKQHLVKRDLIPVAVNYWQKTLQVRRTNGPIKLNRQCSKERIRFRDGDVQPYCVDGCANTTYCGDIAVPESHLEACRKAPTGDDYQAVGESGSGVENADFVLYVSAKSLERCFVGSTVAYAAYCQLESALDRPVAGYVNLCPDSLSTKSHDLHQMHSTIKHEILHALGFSVGLFAFFRDGRGQPLTARLKSTGRPPYNAVTRLYQWSDNIVKSVVRSDWKVRSGAINRTINMIVTPRVRAEVRRHFNCSTLDGAELEDQGINGTTMTHWEKRVFENEMMTGTYTQNPVVSRITLALMEDSGWYHVIYDNADEYLWGKNLGCDFVTKSCMDWIESKKLRGERVHPYCERIKKGNLFTECTEDRGAVAICNLVEYSASLPEQYQYFNQLQGVPSSHVTNYAGSVALADYCPYAQEFNWKKEERVVRGSRCDHSNNNADFEINYALELYGRNSKCFDHGSHWSVQYCSKSYPLEHWGSGCYEYTCSNETGLSVIINGISKQCLYAGQVVKLSIATSDWLHNGTIVCPACSELCVVEDVVCPSEADLIKLDSAPDDLISPCNSARTEPSFVLCVQVYLTTLFALTFNSNWAFIAR